MAKREINRSRDAIDLAFVEEYFKDFNATAAIIRVQGEDHFSSRDSARHAGWRMLRKLSVQEEIRLREVALRAQRRMSAQEFADQLLEDTQVELIDFFDEQGNLLPFSEMKPAARRQIASIEFEQEWYTNPITGEIKLSKVPKIKLWDKRKAQEMYGKWKKMFTDKVEHTGEGGGPVRVAFEINGVVKKGQDT